MSNKGSAPIHIIRLHGPWSAEVLERWDEKTESAVSFKCQIPCDWSQWLGVEFRGRVKYSRSFGMPTGLQADQQVQLRIEGVDFQGLVRLNGHELGEVLFESPRRFSIRPMLQRRNLLTVEIDLPVAVDRGCRNGLAGGLTGSVRLEISPT